MHLVLGLDSAGIVVGTIDPMDLYNEPHLQRNPKRGLEGKQPLNQRYPARVMRRELKCRSFSSIFPYAPTVNRLSYGFMLAV